MSLPQYPVTSQDEYLAALLQEIKSLRADLKSRDDAKHINVNVPSGQLSFQEPAQPKPPFQNPKRGR